MSLPAENRIDVADALRHAHYDGAIWSLNCEQLNTNLLRLSTGAGIPKHVNNDLDVLLVVFEGQGELLVGDDLSALAPGVVVLVPRGSQRMIRCLSGPLVYLTAHRQRGGLMPT